MLERGEKLGINQAVRDAMGEIKRNVQSLNENRHSPQAMRQAVAQDAATRAVAAVEKRNKVLAGVLDESISSLKSLATSDLEDGSKVRRLVDLAAAKLEFVKVHLEDSTIDIPDIEGFGLRGAGDEKTGTAAQETADQKGQTNGASEAEATADVLSTLDLRDGEASRASAVETTMASSPGSPIDPMDTSEDGRPPSTPAVDATETRDGNQTRPPHPIPTRSTLAQSSFSWMLEPDEAVSQSRVTSPAKSRSPVRLQRTANSTAQRTKRPGHGSRERNAFLFGEVIAESDGTRGPSTGDIFGMEPVTGKQKKSKDYGLW